MFKYVCLAISGLLSGILGGMGMGGGTVLIPILTIFFNIGQHFSQGINLISFIPMSIVALIIHCKNKLVIWKKLYLVIIPAVILGGIGSYFVKFLDGDLLKRIFGGFLLALAVLQFFSDKIIKNQK